MQQIAAGSKSPLERESDRCQKTKSELENCPYNTHFTDRKVKPRFDSHGKIRPQAGPLNHRKPDSSPQSPQYRAAAPGIPDRKGRSSGCRRLPASDPAMAIATLP